MKTEEDIQRALTILGLSANVITELGRPEGEDRAHAVAAVHAIKVLAWVLESEHTLPAEAGPRFGELLRKLDELYCRLEFLDKPP